MYSIRSFLVSGLTVFGTAGALIGGVSGLGIGATIAVPLLLGSLVEPWVAVIAIVVIPLAVGICALVGAFAGAVMGTLRAAIIGNALSEGRGWLVALLAILLAVFFVDLVSGLALFLIWGAFRFMPLNEFSQLSFFRVMWRYVFIYALLYLVVGAIGGSGVGGILGYFANEANDYSAINDAVSQLSQFVNSFYLEFGADTTEGLLSAGLSGAVFQDTNVLDIESSFNFSNAEETIFSYTGEATSDINDFLGSLQGAAVVEQAGKLPSQLALAKGAAAEFFGNSQLATGAVGTAVNGGILGATLAVVYGIVFSIILSILDFLVVKNVSNKNLPFGDDDINFADLGAQQGSMDAPTDIPPIEDAPSSPSGKESKSKKKQ